ncbi:hypothetical protein BH09SUM1_BH09SUM1_26710 [soil metagenome]
MPGSGFLDIHEGGSPRVLLCDEDAAACTAVKASLEREQIRVETVYSADEVQEETRRAAFDLLLLDRNISEVNGLELTTILREKQSPKLFLPIVLLTEDGSVEARREALKAGVTDCVLKPINALELAVRVRNLIGAKRLHDRAAIAERSLELERGKLFEIQSGLLPRDLPVMAGAEFGAGYLPCMLGSGDFYDVVVRANGRVVIAVGDVSGHGIASAMSAGTMRSVLRWQAEEGVDLVTIMARLNDALCHGLDDYSFVTFYLAEFDPATGMLDQLAAGHHAALVQNTKTGDIVEAPLNANAPLGIEKKMEYKSAPLQLSPDERLIVYTDGLIEQTCAEGKYYELDGLRESLRGAASIGAAACAKRLLEDFQKFTGARRQGDDVTVLVMDMKRQ